MNTEVKGNMVKVKRGSFTDASSGELRSYCHFYVLSQGITNENETGYDYEKFSCKVENYNSILELIKLSKPVLVSIEMIKQKDDTYRRRAVKINDLNLVL